MTAASTEQAGEPENANNEIEISKPEPPINPGDHRLQHAYCLWYNRKPSGKTPSSLSFDQSLRLVSTFRTVEEFWRCYCHLVRPSDLTSHSDLHLFKRGIKPMWEDEANRRGGKWIVRLRKNLASRCWENLVMAMLGEQFMVGEEICGCVVSIRYQEDILSVWNRSADDTAVTNRIRDTMMRVLNLPANTIIEYKRHDDSIRPCVDMEVDEDVPQVGGAIVTTPTTPANKKANLASKPFTLKKWNMVAMWSWDVINDVCAICREKAIVFILLSFSVVFENATTALFESSGDLWKSCQSSSKGQCHARKS
ncbi:unnamed protein product [Cyprideis torosa]|uniref:Uncharacterized protein n=1 Tax=Cyprideis torosa TaxID=163714 RepID=A0A7R8WD53_9CRUS|nr:unnamed protein product [Cyprideis torosa]CAG0894219.1 unnamed protein product [Cyprideis torosa]